MGLVVCIPMVFAMGTAQAVAVGYAISKLPTGPANIVYTGTTKKNESVTSVGSLPAFTPLPSSVKNDKAIMEAVPPPATPTSTPTVAQVAKAIEATVKADGEAKVDAPIDVAEPAPAPKTLAPEELTNKNLRSTDTDSVPAKDAPTVKPDSTIEVKSGETVTAAIATKVMSETAAGLYSIVTSPSVGNCYGCDASLPSVLFRDNYTGPYISDGKFQSSVYNGTACVKDGLAELSRWHDSMCSLYGHSDPHRILVDRIYYEVASKIKQHKVATAVGLWSLIWSVDTIRTSPLAFDVYNETRKLYGARWTLKQFNGVKKYFHVRLKSRREVHVRKVNKIHTVVKKKFQPALATVIEEQTLKFGRSPKVRWVGKARVKKKLKRHNKVKKKKNGQTSVKATIRRKKKKRRRRSRDGTGQ